MVAISSWIIFVLELIKYLLTYYVCFTKRVKHVWIAMVMSIIPVLISSFQWIATVEGRYVITCACVLLSMLFMMQEQWKQRFINLFELLFLVLCVDEAWGRIIKLCEVLCGREVKAEIWHSVLMNSFTIVTLGGILGIKCNQSGVGRKFWQKITTKLHYLVIVMVLLMLITISGLGFVGKDIQRVEIVIFIDILCIIAYFAVGILGVFVIEIRRVNHKMEEMLHREKLMNNMQEYYYKSLLEKEEDTRRYRHDMMNHIMVLNGMAEKQSTAELVTYLEKMQEQIIHIQRKNYVTGNQTLDIIMNYHLGRLPENVSVQIVGRIVQDFGIDSMTLCTIYANLLQNAIEELSKEGGEKFLKIKFTEGSEFVQIVIQNNLSDESRQKKDLLESQKEDKRNHGIGLRNVQEAVNECGGKLELIREEKSFTAQVILQKK